MYQTILVGCGNRGRDHIQAIQDADQLQLSGLVDTDDDALHLAKLDHGVPGWRSLQDALAQHRAEIVVLATHAKDRAQLCETAAQFDFVKAIVLEKPMANSLEEARHLTQLCETRGILLVVSHQLRCCAEYVAAHKAIDEQRIGRVTHLRGNCYGNLLNQGPHLIDAVHWFTGGKRPLWVSARATTDPHTLQRFAPAQGENVEDALHPAPGSMSATIEFEGGVRADLEMGLLYQRSETFVDDWLQKRVTVVGTEGMVECQTAGHFKLLTKESPHWQFDAGDIPTYKSATRRFYEELATALRDGTGHRCSAESSLVSMEILSACAQSAIDGQVVAWPLRLRPHVLSELRSLGQHPTSNALNSVSRCSGKVPESPPRICVILPVPDHRGHLLDCVDSWLAQQGIADEQYELILVANGTESELVEQLRERLRPQDRLLQLATDNETRLYDLAIRETDCDWLLMTEPHCLAEPFCLQQLMGYLQDTGLDGACLRSLPGNVSHRFARQEHRAYCEGFQNWSRPGDWRKVILRGLALRRQDYLDVGGFEWQFGRFAEWALAAALHNHGTRLGYASGAAVIHFDNNCFGDLFPPVFDFARGECVYRDHHDPDYCDRYFGCPAEWQLRSSFNRDSARASLLVALQYFWRRVTRGQIRDGQTVATLWATMFRLLPMVVIGPRYQAALARLRMEATRFMVSLPTSREDRLYRRFQTLYQAMVHYARVDYLTSQPQPPDVTSTVLAHDSAPSEAYELASMSQDDLVGFHVAETYEGSGFRWSEPIAQIRLSELPGDMEITLETGSIRNIQDGLHAEFYWNGKRITDGRKTIVSNCIVARVDRDQCNTTGRQQLGIACRPLRRCQVSPEESRKLGLPIFRVRVKRLAATNEP